MTPQKLTEPLQPGTVVKIHNSGFHRAWIVEYRGPLGPKGARVYRVLVVKKPRMHIEVLEDQLEVLDDAFFNGLARTVNAIPQAQRTLGRIFAHALVRHPQLIPVAARFFI